MMKTYYAIYYRDKDGFSLPYEEKGKMDLFISQQLATTACNCIKDDITNKLNPKIEYKRVGPIWNRRMERVPPKKLDQWEEQHLRQLFQTLSVKPVKVSTHK